MTDNQADALISNLESIAKSLDQIALSLKSLKPVVSALSEIADSLDSDSIVDQLKIHNNIQELR